MGDRSATWKWGITGLLLLATTINYMDRVTLSNASVRVISELGLTKTQYGNLELAFGWAFGLGSICFGFIADRWRVYLLYPLVLALWSIMGIATGFSQDFTQMLVCRTLLGFFEAGHWPCALKTTFALLNEKDRNMGNSILQSGASIGAIITPQIMRMLMTDEPGSWRFAFIAVGATGFLWLIAWFIFLRPGDLDRAPRPEEAAADRAGLWRIIMSSRFWAVAILVMSIQPVWHIYRAWLPLFLQTGRGYTEASALNFNSVFYLATDAGCLIAGAISLWLVQKRGRDPHQARRLVFMGACVLTSTSVFLPYLGKGPLLLATLLVVGAGALALFPCYYSFTQEISGRHVGRLTGILALWVWTVTSPMQPLFGQFADRTGTYDIPLVVAGLMPWIGVLAMKLLWDRAAPRVAS